MWHNIVVFLPDSRSAPALLQAAAQIAALSQGRFRGLFIKKLPLLEYAMFPPSPDLGGGPPAVIDPELAAALEAGQEQTAQELRQLFHDQAHPAALGLEVSSGMVLEIMLQATHSADLVVMGRGLPEAPGTLNLSDLTRTVLKHSWAPVWLPALADTPISGPILAAYDGSRAANRVLRQVAPWARRLRLPLTVIAIGPQDTTTELLAEAQQYLLPYDLDLTLSAREGKPSQVLPELVAAAGFALIGLGAHGHSKLKDLLLGTTTETLLARHLESHFLVCA